MTHTIDTIMALADDYAEEYSSAIVPQTKQAVIDSRAALHAALVEALAQPHNADPSCTTVALAEMILSDCGCSSNNTSLVSRVANRIDAHIQAAQPVREPLRPEQIKAASICHDAERVSVSMVQRLMCIGYNEAQSLCESIIKAGLVDGLTRAPSLHGIGGDV